MLILASPFVFVPLLAATMIIGGFVFAYLSHCFLTIVEQTSAGNDEVVWPNDPIYDWLWEAVYMLWLVGLWLGPIVLVLRGVTESGATQVLVVAAALVWLFFPITLLSSMSATSRWMLFSPRLAARLLGQRFGSLLLFYLVSAPALAAGAALLYLAFFTMPSVGLLAAAAVGLAAALFIYARQLGRLAHLVEHTDGGRKPASADSSQRRPRRRRVRVPEHQLQPSDLPPVMTPLEGPITGYDVRYDDRPVPEPPPPPRKRPIDLDDVPYELQNASEVLAPRPLPTQYSAPSEYEMALAVGGTAPPPPAHPWAAGVFNFPLYQESLVAWVKVGGGLTLLGLMVRALVEFKPW
jgi:hypothetical protein